MASASIVTNGGFETGDLTGWTYAGSGTTPGIGITVLTTGGSNTTGYGDAVPNYEGTHAAFFVDDNAQESISQSVALSGGQQYTLSFALYATASGAANPFSFTLASSVGADVLSSLTNSSSTTDVPVGVWTLYTYVFTVAATDSYQLSMNFSSGATPSKDVLIDAVDISAVPLPAGVVLLGSGLAAAFGAGAVRRRKATKAA
ncbi:carbohydrate binding domain-containing protein [Aestuariivirga sp.]|uniref:carbohydrate binding domain-containing protein n=1 Tax=Aestuariivirga sp. TaxID=2650926 RepID=UPI0039E2487E